MNRLKELRKNKNLKQVDIAKLLSISNTTISMWETGKAKPAIEKIFKLAEILGVSPQEIIECFKNESI